MKRYEYNQEKNKWLKAARGISFTDVIKILQEGKVLDTIDHPNKKRYANQKMFLVEFDEFVYAVPFVEDEEKYFLKTIFPSRKYTKKYLEKEKYEKNKEARSI